jgi:hypothetical protein
LIAAREGRLDLPTLRRVHRHLGDCERCFRAVQVVPGTLQRDGKE